MGISLMVASAYIQTENQKTTAQYNKRIADANAKLVDISAERAIKNSVQEAAAHKRKADQAIGKQRALAAAAGVDVSTGTIADIGLETAKFAAEDVRTIKNNGYLEAFGLASQANNMRFEGEAQVEMTNATQNSSLIVAGMQGYASKNAKTKP